MDTNTLTVINEFEQTIHDHAIKPRFKTVQEAAKNLHKVKVATPPLASQSQVHSFMRERAKLITQLADDALVARLSTEYTEIDPTLFELKRYLVIELDSDGKNARVIQDQTKEPINEEIPKSKKDVVDLKLPKRRIVKTPLFVQVPLFRHEDIVNIGKYHTPGQSRYGYKTRIEVSISTKFPGSIGPNLTECYRKAMAAYHLAMSDLLKDPTIGESIDLAHYEHPELFAVWIPTLDTISVKTTIKEVKPRVKDPAMFMKVNEHYFLLATWEVDDEEPFEHFLREYSVGKLKMNKTKQ